MGADDGDGLGLDVLPGGDRNVGHPPLAPGRVLMEMCCEEIA